jgi:CRISPR-associated endonuclease/helicase Cas3
VKPISFDTAFKQLTGNDPFPWQRDLYETWFSQGRFPDACTLPTGLGKTSVVVVWLIALANAPERVPRRLVYVVNRRTVVDQTTAEAVKIRVNAEAAGVPKPAISTLRGQFADNREWSADPSKPAIIVGTVDMIGSRLLFSGYGIGFKSRPLHAGFLGQDVLIVHDEAHLEPAFQDLLLAIKKEQHEGERTGELPWPKLQMMELTATSRGSGAIVTLSDKDRAEPEVRKRIEAKKTLHLHENKEEKKLAEEIADLALKHSESDRAVLVFVRKVEDVDKVVKRLPKDSFEQLTGTLRGKERDALVTKRRFQRFLPESNRDKDVTPADGTVYLVCTSAGEVGVNISADDLVCDLTTFDSMAQRFGRVNRFGARDDTRIDVVYPNLFDEKDDYDSRLKKTLELLRLADGNGSPAALSELHRKAEKEGSGAEIASTDRTAALREYILATYAPQPKLLPVSDILFDSWALTSIRGKLPGRPLVEPYLHGISEWEPPETHVAWREEVEVITENLLDEYKPEDLLEDFPLKPHELLRDNSARVFDRLKKLKAASKTPVWLASDDGTVEVTTLAELIDAGKDGIERKTVLLPPRAGGLANGMLTDNPEPANDVADESLDEKGNRRRVRVWDDDEGYEAKTEDMRLVRRIDLPAGGEDEDKEGHSWHWFELPKDGDTDGSKSNKKPVLWAVHTEDVTRNATAYMANLPLPQVLKDAIVLAARWHDLGKQRKLFQAILGNFKYPGSPALAKSGKKGGRLPELFRHEFGSLIDVLDEKQSYCAELRKLSADMQDVVLHLIAVHHGYGRPHFPPDRAFDPEPKGQKVDDIAAAVAQRFARLQRRYGRWGLAYLESLLRAADYAASAKPSTFVEDEA